MTLSWRKALLLLLLVTPLWLGAGCGGINAGGSVSPMMFLLPGIGQTAPVKPEPEKDLPPAQPLLVAQSI